MLADSAVMVATRRITGTELQKIRREHLRENPLCVHCLALGLVRSATQLDHIVPLHKGGAEEKSNRQGLCDECHALKTADDIGNVRRGGCDLSGEPLDPKHPWRARTLPKDRELHT